MKYDFYDERIIYDAPSPNIDPPDELQQQQAAEQEERTGFSTMAEIMPGAPITDADLPDRPTAKEVACWLRKHPNAIYIWANKGLIPARKVRGAWLFDKAVLLNWARQQQEAAMAMPEIFRLLKDALPIIEAEAERRTASMNFHGENQCITPYWREMRELADRIGALMREAQAKEEAA